MRGAFYRLRQFLHRGPLGSFKRRRALRFFELMRPRPGERLLDIGGGDGEWWVRFAPAERRRQLRLFLCDIHHRRPIAPGVAGFVVADARRLPFRDGAFDIAFSNSVLEHVGDLERQRLYASEIRRVARRYFVQVANKHFPIEPHFLIPFLQYLPRSWRRMLTRSLFGFDDDIDLPDRGRVRLLFPEATIESERFLGLTKAFYIWRPGEVARPLVSVPSATPPAAARG